MSGWGKVLAHMPALSDPKKTMGGRRKDQIVHPPADLPGCRWVPLTKGKFALIDEADASTVCQFLWSCHHTGYAYRGEYKDGKTKMVMLHRFLMDFPKGAEVDHVNGNRLDNRRSNLRLVTQQEQARNKMTRPTRKSPYKGVFWMRKNRKWQAQICDSGKIRYLGLHLSAEDAARAYNAAALETFGPHARLNVIPENRETIAVSDTAKLTVYVPADVHRALKLEAVERGVSMGDLIVEALNSRITFLPRAMRKPEEP